MIKVLILDDQESYLRALSAALRREFDMVTVADLSAAKGAMDESVRVALVDVRLSEDDPNDKGGVEFLEWCRGSYPRVPVLMMSAFRDFDVTVEAINLGADYFLKKPIDLRELKALLNEFGEHGRMPDRTAALRKSLDQEEP
jgi:DNA-binding NtrC family response regulator